MYSLLVQNSIYPDNNTDTSSLYMTYHVIIPCFSAAGIFGNLLSLYILSSNKNFRGFMFTYMKGLAITDTLYLISVLQVRRFLQHSIVFHHLAIHHCLNWFLQSPLFKHLLSIYVHIGPVPSQIWQILGQASRPV